MTRGSRIVGLVIWVMWVLGWALWLSGCMEGGVPVLEGTWYEGPDASGCTAQMVFETYAFTWDTACPGVDAQRITGNYYADGTTLRLTDGEWRLDARYELARGVDHQGAEAALGDVLILDWGTVQVFGRRP
jgi:hypothetical protein